MSICKYCREALAEGAKKCKTCGEPFYFFGKMLKWTPMLSIVIAILSLCFAYSEKRGKEKANLRAETAQSQLFVKEKAADQAIREISEKLSDTSRNEIIKNLRLPTNTTLEQLEQRARTTPENSDVQKKLFLYRSLKKPEIE